MLLKYLICAGATLLCILTGYHHTRSGQSGPFDTQTYRKEGNVTREANGTFQVKLTPMEESDTSGTLRLGRMLIEKVFEGELSGTGRGEMLTAVTGVEGSAGYVAIERFTGALHGRTGSFVLQHHGLMSRGDPRLIIVVVHDSGTDELDGISGEMTIDIKEGKHFYRLTYSLPVDP